MLINHQSVSRKKCYDTCPQQYKFRYHLKVPRPGEEPFYFTYGTIVHRVAELYVQNKGERAIEEIVKDVFSGKCDLDDRGRKCPPLTEDYKKKFPKHIKAVKELIDRIGTTGITEHKFEYDLDPPHKKMVLGFIDLLIVGKGKAFIIDYKTTKKGKFRVNKNTVKTDLQLRMYSRVIQREFGVEAKNIKAAMYYVEGANMVGCCYSDESLEAAEKELLEAYDRIEASDPEKVWGKVGWHCKNCDYNTLCSFYTNNDVPAWDGNMDSLGGGW